MPYRYVIKKRASSKIWSFYRNVSKKYKHTYCLDDMVRNVQDAVRSINQIENTLPRRQPTLKRWKGRFMSNTEKWYYCYTIDDDVITIWDACHAQNMHE